MDHHLSNFQLDEMALLRSLSGNQSAYNTSQRNHSHHNQPQHHQINVSSPARVTATSVTTASNTASSFSQFHGNIDILFQQNTNSSPHINSFLPIGSKNSSHPDISPQYQTVTTSTPQNDCFDQEDIFTPLISPAMTPSRHYQMHTKNKSIGNSDINFSPLSSPAMLPHNRSYNEQFEEMSANQICEQYEQLEQAKIIITQKLTELQKSQYDYNQLDTQSHIQYQRNDPNRLIPVSEPDSFANHQIVTSTFPSTNNNPMPIQAPGSSKQDDRSSYQPATPASLMNMKRKKPSSRSPPVNKGKEPLGPSSRQAKKLPLIKKSRRSEEISHNNISPRALKPLLISPTLNPRPPDDAERILATRSNYQNLMEGKAAELGIAFSSQIKSGLEVRRTAHKAAEQKRRDSLKEWFDRLRNEVEDGYVKKQSNLVSRVIKEQALEKKKSQNSDDETMKPLSKVLLLQYAYEYITSLKGTISEKDAIIEQLKKEGGD